MQAFYASVQARRSLILRFLLACLLAGILFALAYNLLSSHTVSIHRAVRSRVPTSANSHARFVLDRYSMPDGTACTDNCTGGYEVVPFTSFTEAWGEFQIPACPTNVGGGDADIWVELGGDGQGGASPQPGLAAGIIIGSGFAELAIDSVGTGGSGLHIGSRVTCGDEVLAFATATSATAEDLTLNRTLTVSRTIAVSNQDAQCIVQMDNPNASLYNFGTLNYSGPCWAFDPSTGWQQFGYYGGFYLWMNDNSGNTLAGDPNASRSGIGSVEQVQWYAAT